MGWIAAVESASEDGRFQLHPFRLGETGVEPSAATISLHGPTKRRRALAALNGNWLWAGTRDRRSGAPCVARFDLAASTSAPAAVAPLLPRPEKFPAAIVVHDQVCLLGWNAEVHALRFGHDGPWTSILRAKGCPDWKPFDVMCVRPPLVLAVDDIVWPKWRMCIDLSILESPAVVWGHEFEHEEAYAEYLGATACATGIVLWSAYGNTYGSGQFLELVSVTTSGISHLAELSLRMGPRARVGDRSAVLKEHRFAANATRAGTGEPRPGGRDARRGPPVQSRILLDKTPFAFWTGISAVEDQLFVGAGSQGLLRFRAEERGFRMLPRAVIGECLDVVSCGRDIAVLVRDEQGRRVLQFRPDPACNLIGVAEAVVNERVSHLIGQSI